MLDEKTLRSRSFYNETTGEKGEDGFWKLTVVINEKLVFMDGTERKESIEAMCMDKNFNIAHELALHSALQELRDVVYDKGFDSLVEGKDYQRSLEVSDGSDSKADEITTS